MSDNVTTMPAPQKPLETAFGSAGGILAPSNLGEAMKLADVLASSTIVPKDFQNSPGNVLVAIQWGSELGLAPLQALQNIAVINGRPALWGDAVLALCQASPVFEWINETFDDTTKTATCAVKRRGMDETVRTFSFDDAKVAGLLDKQGPWRSYPRRMAQLRARGFALRDTFADVLRGVRIAEEERDITPDEAPQTSGPDRAQGGAARLKEKMRARRQGPAEEPDEAPSLGVVITMLSTAPDLESLDALGEKYISGSTGEDRKRLARAYKARKGQLQPAEEHQTQPVNEV